MKCYRLLLDEKTKPEFYATLAAAKAATKIVPKLLRDTVFIDEIEVDTTKDGVLAILNDVIVGFGVLRSWQLTARGGLELVPSE